MVAEDNRQWEHYPPELAAMIRRKPAAFPLGSTHHRRRQFWRICFGGIMEDKRQFTGWFIPVELRTVHRLDWIECALWAEINEIGKLSGGCRSSNQLLGDRIGLSADRTSKLVSKLKDVCVIKQTGFDGRSRTLIAVNSQEIPNWL